MVVRAVFQGLQPASKFFYSPYFGGFAPPATSGSGGFGSIKSRMRFIAHGTSITFTIIPQNIDGSITLLMDHHSTLHGYIERGMTASDWAEQIGDGVDGYGEP